MEPNQTLALSPRVARKLFLLGWFTLMVLVWGFYFFADHRATVTFERNLVRTTVTEAIVLDDHIERSVAGVFNSLLSVQALAELMPINLSELDSNELGKLIADDLSVRSVSLLDKDAKVIASSNPKNIGLSVPVSMLGQTVAQAAEIEVPVPQLHAVQPYRDLFDLAGQRPSKTQSLMLASLPFKKNNVPYLLMATINIGLFENLWERIGHNEATEIALMGFNGEILFSHDTQKIDHQRLSADLLKRIESRQIGHFYFGESDQYLVVYRATSQHPKIFVTITNRDALSGPLREEEKDLRQLASGLTVLFSVLFWLIYIWYRRYEKAVTYSSNLLRGITAHVMMTRSDLAGSIMEANEPFLKVTGYALDEVIGQNHRMFSSGTQPRDFYRTLWETITKGEIWKGTFRNKTKSGETIWVNATIIPFRDQWGQVLHYTALFSDITKAIQISERFERERKQRESLEQMNHALRTDLNLDHLTSLANRRGLDQFLEELERQPECADAPFAMLMLDLDHFKHVNDTWGHDVGDEVLKEVTHRWASQIRSSDMLARFGGEEFIAVLSRTDQQGAEIVAEKIRRVTQQKPVIIHRDGTQLTVPITVSIGIALSSQLKGTELKQMYRAADNALYEAKHSGRNCIRSRKIER